MQAEAEKREKDYLLKIQELKLALGCPGPFQKQYRR